MDDSLIVDISDALSERDRVRFTVHTKTKLPQFAKPVLSVVRQHEEFIWLHDCLVDNDQYAGYIIPPPPPRPDFDSSREKLQRLGDCESSLTKDEFAKMKQELEAEYLAIFKKTVAMHEIFLQRLASHEKFREDSNFKIFLEYENELAVRGKSKREKIAGSIQNIGKSLTDFVITTSQVANSNSITNLASNTIGHQNNLNNNNITSTSDSRSISSNNNTNLINNVTAEGNQISNSTNDNGRFNNAIDVNDNDLDEQYFEKERLFLALYYNSIRESAICADKVTQAHRCVAESYLNLSQQLVRLASIEVVPITSQTKDSSSFVACPLPSLTLPSSSMFSVRNGGSKTDSSSLLASDPSSPNSNESSNSRRLELTNDSRELGDDENGGLASSSKVIDADDTTLSKQSSNFDNRFGDNKPLAANNTRYKPTGGCANDHTSEGLKKLLLNISDFLEQAKKIESRIASDQDLKLTDTLLYYKRDTIAAQELLMRRLRFMSEYENATKNLQKARAKGLMAMQYAEVIQKQAKENFLSISNQAKQELINYKRRRVASFKRAFSELAELEIKHLRSHSQLILNCLNICRGLDSPSSLPVPSPQPAATTSNT